MAMEKRSARVLAKIEILFEKGNFRNENRANKKLDTRAYTS